MCNGMREFIQSMIDSETEIDPSLIITAALAKMIPIVGWGPTAAPKLRKSFEACVETAKETMEENGRIVDDELLDRLKEGIGTLIYDPSR